MTRFTAAPGMLVRRNHNANTRSAAVPGEVRRERYINVLTHKASHADTT